MATKAKRAALYLRVSTDGQTTENQRLALVAVAEQRGWTVTNVYEDADISGAKGRDKRPGLDALLKDATRARFDVVMAWAMDRLGRSLLDLLDMLRLLDGANVDLFLHQQAFDTTTVGVRMLFQVTGAFSEFERGMIRNRVNAGLDRARAKGVPELRVAAINRLLCGWVEYFNQGPVLPTYKLVRWYVQRRLQRWLTRRSGQDGTGYRGWAGPRWGTRLKRPSGRG